VVFSESGVVVEVRVPFALDVVANADVVIDLLKTIELVVKI
jgi:hypothetical protein